MAKTIFVKQEAVEKYRSLTEILQLEDLQVVGQSYDDEANTLHLKCVPRWEVAVCPHCQQLSEKVHDYPQQRHIHDSPIRGQRVVLVFDVYRFECARCHKHFMQPIRDVVPDCTYTYRLAVEVANPRRKQDVATLAATYGLGYRLVESILLKAAEDKLSEREGKPIAVSRLGIDEISQKKGMVSTC